MSKTEGFLVLDTEIKESVQDKPNVEKGKQSSFGNKTRKKLADISNLPNQARVSTLDERSHFMQISMKENIDQLQKENITLKAILAERTKIIEVTGTELQKMRAILLKLQQQNLQLAQTNNQMVKDLNLGKDRLKALQHELGCKNCLLIVKKLEKEERLKPKRCEKFDDEVELTNCDATEVAKGSSEVGGDVGKCGDTRRRPKSKSLGPRQVISKDEIENKRRSARFRPEEIKPPSVPLEKEDTKLSMCSPSIQGDPPQENGSASASVSVPHEGREQVPRHEAEKKRPCARRQSSRFKCEEPKHSDDLFEKPTSNPLETEDTKLSTCSPSIEDDLPQKNGPTSASVSVQNEGIEQVSRHETGKKRPCARRQSARFKAEEPKPSDDLFEIVDANVAASVINDGRLLEVAALVIQDENGSASVSVSVQDEGREQVPRPKVGYKRPCVRRQSARFKSEEPKPSDDLFETVDANVAASVIQDEGREVKNAPENKAVNKRPCIRRQSASFKPVKPEPSDASVINEDDSFPKNVSISTSLLVKNEDNEVSPGHGFETLESRRSSISRPSRQAAKRVQSYKEIPLNVKMRRAH